MPNSNPPVNPTNVKAVQTAQQQYIINMDESPIKLKTSSETPNLSQKFSKRAPRVLPVKISNANESFTVIALFDSGSDFSLLAQNVTNYLNLNGKYQSVTIHCNWSKVESQVKVSQFFSAVKVTPYEN